MGSRYKRWLDQCGGLAGGGFNTFVLNFQDATKFPIVSTGGTMTAAAFLATSGITITHATEAAGVGMTVEAGPVAYTSVTGSPGTLIQGAANVRFGGRAATSAGWGVRKEGARTTLMQKNQVAAPTTSGPWSAGTSDSAVAGPDGLNLATRSNFGSGGLSAYQDNMTPTPTQNQQGVMSSWLMANSSALIGTLVLMDAFGAMVHNTAWPTSWGRIGTILSQPFASVTRLACVAVSGIAYNNLAAIACDASWYLPMLEMNTQFFSTPIWNANASAATRNADIWQYATAANLVNSGHVNFETQFVADGVMPYQYVNGDVFLWWKDASNWCRIMHRNPLGYGGYLVAAAGGNVETIGPVQWSDQDTVRIYTTVGGGQNFTGWYTLNGGNPIFCGQSAGNFKGANVPSTGTINFFDNNVVSDFFGTVHYIKAW